MGREKMRINSNAGETLRKVRRKIGWTQNQLAKYLEIDNTLICRWEHGERPIPSDILRVIKKAVRMNKNDIKLVNFSPDKKTSVGQHVLNSNSSNSLGEKGDFASRVFKEITLPEVLHYFKSLSNAKKLAGELMRSRKVKRTKKTIPTLESLKHKKLGKNIQTAVTYIDPNNKYNWLQALYPGRDFSKYESKVKQRTFTWDELFRYRPESERLVPQVGENGS